MRKFCLAFSALVLSVSAQAASVWQVSDGHNTLYIGGTLHLLSADDYPLPEAYDQAYQKADTLVFETDMQAVSSAAFATKMMQQNTYAPGQSLADDLNAKTLQKLSDYLARNGLPEAQLMQLKPAMLGLTLTMLEYQKVGLTSQGVDAYYHTKAQQDGKPQDWFETPDEQLSYITSMAEGQENEFVQYTLEDLGELSNLITPLTRDWRKGDVQGLYDLMISDLTTRYPKVHDDLLVSRNNNWLPKLKALMQTPETEFVLVGTLHLPGEEGILAMLEEQGFTLKQLN